MHRLSFEKVFYHLDTLQAYLKEGDCFPVHMIVGLTNRCNHNCIWCYGYDTRAGHYNENDFARTEMIVTTIRDAAQEGLRSITLVGTGEPTLHPGFADMVREIRQCGVEIGMFTNGSRLDGARAEAVLDTHTFLRLSCSAENQAEHNRIHHAGKPGNDFDRVVENIRHLLKRRGERMFPTIGVQFAVSHRNWRSLLDAARFWKALGVDYYALKPVYKNPHIQEHEDNEAPLAEVAELMRKAKQLEDERFKVYAKHEQFDRLFGASTGDRGYTACHGQAFTTFLDPDGTLFLCGNWHGKAQFSIGRVEGSGSFRAVWKGERRKEVLSQLDVRQCPRGCRMDPFNLIIEDLLHPQPEIHPNFL